jgi:hypothetical protein
LIRIACCDPRSFPLHCRRLTDATLDMVDASQTASDLLSAVLADDTPESARHPDLTSAHFAAACAQELLPLTGPRVVDKPVVPLAADAGQQLYPH